MSARCLSLDQVRRCSSPSRLAFDGACPCLELSFLVAGASEIFFCNHWQEGYILGR